MLFTVIVDNSVDKLLSMCDKVIFFLGSGQIDQILSTRIFHIFHKIRVIKR